MDRPNSATTVGTGQLVPGIPQAVTPQARHNPAAWATLVSLPCVAFPVLSSHHTAPSAYSFLTELKEPLRTIPGHQHKLERSGIVRGGRLGEKGIPSLPNYI